MLVLLGFVGTRQPAEGQAQGITISAAGMAGGFAVDNGPRGIKGQPYSAEQVSETVQTLPDGTHITQLNGSSKLYRDFEGRIRTEHRPSLPPGVSTSAPPIFVTIWDPIAGFNYNLDERNHTATRFAMQSVRQVNAAASSVPSAGSKPTVSASPLPTNETAQAIRPRTTRESLGSQVMEGVTVEGTRRTTTYPEGSTGNDRSFTTIIETWTSVELKMSVLTKSSDPRRGETTTRLINISRSEPDPALFQVPSDYTIEDRPEHN